MRAQRLSASEAGEAGTIELVWLLGQPHLADYLDFVRDKVVGGDEIPPRRLADEWRAANDHYYDLVRSEAGIADTIERRPLPEPMRKLARRLRANRWFRESFDDLPFRIELVVLDKLIVSQSHVERQFADSLCAGLGAAPDPETLFRFCLPTERPQPPVRVQRLGSDRWIFSSGSTDFRTHPAELLAPDQLKALARIGPAASGIAQLVGFGSNFLSAVRSDRRVVLQNGYHRAYSLRALGITHAPCAVTRVTRKDELKVAASDAVCDDPEFYFAARRPPILRDYFDPRIRKILPVRRMETVIEVEIKTRTSTAADL